MSKNNKLEKFIFALFIGLIFATLLIPALFTQQLLYPFVSTKALVFRSLILLALPLYLYLISVNNAFRPSWKNPLTLAITAFVLFSLISGFVGVNSGRSFWGNYERMDGTYNLLHLFLLYFYLVYIFKAREALGQKFLLGVIWVSSVLSVYAILEKLGVQWFQDASLPERASSTFGNPIFFGSFLVIPIFLSVFFALGESKGFKRNLYWVFSGISALGLYFSATRGALLGLLLGLFVGALVYILFGSKGRLKAIGLFTLLGIGVVFGALFFYGHQHPGSGFDRIFNLSDSNSKARLIQWQSGLKGFKDNPILGVGPQNYNVIANKYFNTEIYKYDNTWFDKPHNYLLEILLTNGAVGLGCYVAVILAAFYAFWVAYKRSLIGFLEFCILAAGMLAYQIQNLFAFDTTSAAWVFFIFLAFASYLLDSVSETVKQSEVKNFTPVPWYANVLLIGGLVLAVYGIVVTDIGTGRVLYNLNIAYALGLNNPKAAEQYFENAENENFIYDLGDVAVKHSEFAVAVGQDLGSTLDSGFVHDILNKATIVTEKVTASIKNNPIYWYHLANDYDTVSIIDSSSVNPKAKLAVQNAINLAPSRVEPKFFLVQIYGLEHNIPEVVKVSEAIVQAVPFYPEAKWRLAVAYRDNGNLEQAVAMANQALQGGYHFKLAKEARWLINYYADKQDLPRVAELYEQSIALSPTDYQLYASLATVYAKLGEKDKAIAAANKVMELNPASADSVNAFLKTLQ